MDYKKIHDRLIQKRRENPVNESEYFEKHHIIPRSLGGPDNNENIVRLTAREHFIIHLLLVRIYPKDSKERSKMLYALKRMTYGNKEQKTVKNSSRLYSYHRKEFSEMMSKKLKGKKHSLGHCNNISKSKIGKKRSDIERYSEATIKLWEDENYRKKQVEKKLGKKLSDSRKRNIGKSLEGKPRSEETKMKIKATKIANRLANPNDHDKHIQCKYCGIKTNAGNIARYHNENCKFRPII